MYALCINNILNALFSDFPWYDKLMSVLNNVFKIKGLRSYQLPTMNATLSGHHVILIMPTGGGKSLCYQLPALVDKGKCELLIFRYD